MVALIQRDSTLILCRDLLSQADLRVLKLTWLCVVAFLPSELSDEAIAEPNKQNTCKVDVTQIHSIFQDVTTSEISVHKSPGLVDDLALDDLTDELTKLLSKRKQLLIKICRCRILFSDWWLI